MNVETALKDVLVMGLFDALEQYPESETVLYDKRKPVDEDR